MKNFSGDGKTWDVLWNQKPPSEDCIRAESVICIELRFNFGA